MKLLVLVLFSVAVSFSTAHAKSAGAKVSKTWFDSAVCTEMKIQRFETGRSAPTNTLTVSDSESIKKFIRQVEKISAEGDEMRSFVAKETIELSFECGPKKMKIEIYDGWFKTPNTAFNSAANIRKVEKQLHAEILATLQPELKKKIFKFQGVDFAFTDFTITFKGVTTFDYAPATISGQDDNFIVRDRSGKTQELKVTSGQLPPQPLPFEVSGTKYVLETYQTKDVGALHDSYFQIHR
jgi:hypothetical protein